MTTPCVAFLQWIYLSKKISTLTILALLSVCIGVALTNSGSSGTTIAGASIAVAAFTVTAFYQVVCVFPKHSSSGWAVTDSEIF
jgi:solute carrier family 35, member E3